MFVCFLYCFKCHLLSGLSNVCQSVVIFKKRFDFGKLGMEKYLHSREWAQGTSPEAGPCPADSGPACYRRTRPAAHQMLADLHGQFLSFHLNNELQKAEGRVLYTF